MSGALLAVITLFGWGIADFLTQRATRKVGISTTLFFSSLFGLIILFPFAQRDFAALSAYPSHFIILALSAAAGLFSSLFGLEAFRRGKLAVVEPIIGLELPFTILLAVLVRGETLGVPEMVLMLIAFVGILVASTSQPLNGRFSKKSLEKGALFGLLAAVSLGASNFVFAVASQEISPIMAIWFGRVVSLIIFGVYLAASRRFIPALHSMKRNFIILAVISALYIFTYICYGIAVTLIPISVVTTISEGFVVLTVLLGVFFNHEKLVKHQYVGIGVVIASILALALIG